MWPKSELKIDVRVDSNEAKIKFETISHPKNEDFPSYNFGAVLCLGSWKNNHRFVFQVRKQQFNFEGQNCPDGCDDQTISGTSKLMINGKSSLIHLPS